MLYIYGERADAYDVAKDYPPRHEVTLEQAAVSIIKNELAFGGRLVIPQCQDRQIVVRTQVFSKTDTTWCTADSAEEMQPLLEMVACFLGVDVAITPAQRTDIWFDSVTPDVAGKPFFVVHALPLLLGERTGRVSMVAYIVGKLSPNPSEESMKEAAAKLLHFPLETLIRIAANVNQNLGFTLDEYITLYGAS